MASLSSTNFKPCSGSSGKGTEAASMLFLPENFSTKNSSVIGTPPLKPI